MYPLKLTAPLKDYIWGGTKLKTDYNKQTDLQKVAESWELSCHKDGNSIIANGEYAGKTLVEYIEQNGKAVLGTNCDRFENFPILIKLIDAKDNLSVQVHPENEYALRVEGEYGKTEMWYIVDCEEGASLLYGFKHDISKEEFKQRIENNTLLEVCNKVEVKKGDVFFIDAGTLHAIGSGILIAEIQQNSNTTYRIYDYGRVGVDGKPRELHVDKAIDVTNLCPPTKPTTPQGKTEKYDGYTKTLLSTCEYFTVYALDIELKADFNVDNTSFQSVLCLEGTLVLSSENGTITLQKGDSVFLPANYGNYTLQGKANVVLTMV
ncbi:class I mannose-6-phosphate isomerase [Paludicola sp. MB14-C6]|uniref:type I phosphomannose isomerase catalytic subunit n=1 Tax=Paludihabitans sp. MB14-C6 TaxID=3070656 RepID=UPI0027DE2A1E|nr:type I phosphomannose isomerase catalytic subunit [Paludicola sp. MB14-C6]WMJ22070.1 class I mannose-6-phosphate isomerase [Paludicola sp. MB14-C6]